MNRIIAFVYIVAALAVFSSCAKAPAPSSQSGDDYSVNENNTSEQKRKETKSVDSDDSGDTSFRITDYDNEPQGDYIGVFYDGNFYGWVSQIRHEDEINSYIEQGDYIGESKEKQIVYEGTYDEIVDGLDDWEPDSDLECNGLNAGTPLYRLGDYIVAVYDTPVEDGTVVAHESDGTQKDIPLYVYGHIYRKGK